LPGWILRYNDGMHEPPDLDAGTIVGRAGRPASWRVLTVVALVAAGLVGCRPPGEGLTVRASMSVSPQTALVDEPVAVSVRGLPAGTPTTVTAKATDRGGTTWEASARFQATSAGVVSLGQPSLGGSWSGVNPMGVFELMAPPSGSTLTAFIYPDPGYQVSLEATVGGRVAATATARRQTPVAAGVAERRLRPAQDGVYGNLYLPKATAAPRPGVLVFGGSDGGLSTAFAASLLAAHGYPSLALAYFKAPGLPATLERIPLEYFTKALAVLRAQPGVDRRRLVVMGASRGGEAALLLGAHFPELVDGVVANVPSSVVNPSGPDASQPAWTLRGRPLPAVGTAGFGQADPAANPQAVIPVERIGGPILLTCGALDLVWPSCAHLDAITSRLDARRFGHPVTALRYPDAGHLVGGLTAWFGSLTDDALTTSGGTVEGTQAAQADAHAKLLAFLGSR
jgi:dienelactone hydrolase